MLLIWGASLVAFNLYKSPRKATNEIGPAQLPTPSSTVGLTSPRKENLLKTRLVHRNDKNAALVKLKEYLITENVSQANEEASALMKDKTWQAVM